MSPDQLATVEAYDSCAEAYDTRIGALPNYNATYDVLLSRLPLGARVLDLACGPANISRYIAARKAATFTCVDLSEQMLRLAGRHLPNARLLRESIIDFTHAESFDLVLNGFGLPYLNGEECARCIRSSAAVLSPGGLLYLSFMLGEGASLQRTSFGGDRLFAMHHHPEERVRRQLEEQGLHVEHRWALDYQESDGSVSTDLVLIALKP